MSDKPHWQHGGRSASAHFLLLLWLLAGTPAWATMPSPDGSIPEPVAEAFRAGLFALPEHALPTGTSSTQTQWRIPVVMIGFSDAPLTITPAEFETALFDSTGVNPSGSVFEYFQWVSGGRVRVTGRVVASITLQGPRDWYAYNYYGLMRESTPQNLYGMTREALSLVAGDVDWSEFDLNRNGVVDMLWVIHQGIAGETTANRSYLWSITGRMSAGWAHAATFVTPQRIPGTANAFYEIDRFSSMPELSTILPGRRAEIGTFCHEFGHALGLPDLYDTSGIPAGVVNVGPGNWSLMSTGAYGGSGLTPEQPTHVGGWCQQFLGWTTPVRPTEDTTITLRPIARGDPPIEVWFQGEQNNEHFLIENRFREGFDQRLPNDGLLITHVDEGLIGSRIPGNVINAGPEPAYVVVEGDGDFDMLRGFNRGDNRDPLPGSLQISGISDETSANLRSFQNAATNLAIGQITRIGADVRFRLQVRPPGWGPLTHVPGSVSAGLDTGRPGRWARAGADGSLYAVLSEVVNGRPQVVLRTRSGSTWTGPEVISLSPVAAFDPSIAVLPGGDLSVIWTDARGGRSSIYLRTRIRGVWQNEVLVSEMEGDSHHATIGADRFGTLQMAWLNDQLSERRIFFRRFAYISPFGMTSPVTSSLERPDPPALEVRPNGSSYLLWSDRAESPARLYFSRFHPDSGLSLRQPVTFTPAASQLGAAIAVDTAGTLHIVWRSTGLSGNELHYQKRRRTQTPAPRDTLLDTTGFLLQNTSIAADDSGGVHVVWEDWGKQFPVPQYKLFRPSRGWDLGATVLPTSGTPGILPIVIPQRMSDVTTLYLEDDGFDLRLVERRRQLGTPTTLATPGPLAGSEAPWRVHPNPLRSGAELQIAAAGPGSGFEIFDLGGRRVADLEARREGEWQRASASPELTRGWPAGIYFARLKGGSETSRFVVLH